MLKYLIEKEFKQFFRNKFLPRMVIMLPFMALLIFPLVANFEIKNVKLIVVDNDKSPLSNQLIKKIESSGYFIITGFEDTYKAGIKNVDDNKADIILEIPQNFEKRLISENKTDLLISANTVNGMRGGLGSSYLNAIVSDFSIQFIKTPLIGAKIIPHYRFNPGLIYRVYMIPAIIIMMLAIICGFLPALNIVSEKESGTIEQMNVTPVSKFYFILAKLIPYWVVGYVVITVCFIAAWLFYGFLPTGSFITLYLFATIFIFAISGFGLVISNYAKTIQQGIFMIFFFVITFIFMSGLYTPVASMPDWAQVLSNVSPLKYIINVFRLVYLKGSTASDLAVPFLALISFAVFFNSWAVISYRKKS